MLETGICGKEKTVVDKTNTAKAMGSGGLEVFATPAMINLIERTAYLSVVDRLDKGMDTVGISLDIQHISATPKGMEVYCESNLIKIDGKRLVFEVSVYDEVGPVGKGTHERFIISSEAFQKKANDKK